MKQKFKRDGSAYQGWLKAYGYETAEHYLKVANGEVKHKNWITQQDVSKIRKLIKGRSYRDFYLTTETVDIHKK